MGLFNGRIESSFGLGGLADWCIGGLARWKWDGLSGMLVPLRALQHDWLPERQRIRMASGFGRLGFWVAAAPRGSPSESCHNRWSGPIVPAVVSAGHRGFYSCHAKLYCNNPVR